MKRVLIVASVISFIEWFNQENVEYLKKTLNCDVDIAVNDTYFHDTDQSRTERYLQRLKDMGVNVFHVEFQRSPFSTGNIKAYKNLKAIIDKGNYDLIHCHTPMASILTRLAAKDVRKRHNAIVMYTCHGFHFHNSSSKLNWILYYPIEKVLSSYCDYLVTINHEDYNRAKSFYTENVRYIPGVGVNLDRILNTKVDKILYKLSLGLKPENIMILSIGELIKRKNHEVIIRALGKLQNPNIFYVIAGKGPLQDALSKLAADLGIQDNVKFLGFRSDIPELCNTADISAFPSKIEGLGLAGIEAMAAGVPLISSNVHGILDYVKDGITGYAIKPDDVDGFAEAINKLASDSDLRLSMREECIKAVQPFDKKNALKEMWNIYEEILKC